MSKYLIATFFLALVSVQAQNTVESMIFGNISSEDGAPLAYATVLINGTRLGTLTDEQGRFEINVPYGKHTVSVSFIGYGNASKTIQTSPENRRIKLDFTLSENTETLDGVTLRSYTIWVSEWSWFFRFG